MKSFKLFLMSAAILICFSSFAQAAIMGEILSAETRTGSLVDKSQMDSFTFTGQKNQGIVILMSEESGSGTNFQPDILLKAPDGTEETSKWANGAAFISDHQLEQTGTYTIAVMDAYADDIGNYSLSLLLIPGATVSPQDPDGGDIASGETKTNKKIDFNADTDAYTFSGAKGQGIDITMSELSGSGTKFQPDILLLAPDGTEETSNWRDGAAYLSHQLEQTGTYTIAVMDAYGDDTGIYNLSFLIGPTTSTTTAISSTTSISSTTTTVTEPSTTTTTTAGPSTSTTTISECGAAPSCDGCCISYMSPESIYTTDVQTFFMLRVTGCRFTLMELLFSKVTFNGPGGASVLKAPTVLAINNLVFGVMEINQNTEPGCYEVTVQTPLKKAEGYSISVQ
jgi:hypothetical protein